MDNNEINIVRELAKQILDWTVDEMGLSETDKSTPVKGVLYEMKKRNSHYGLATLCIGGGMGTALVIEMDQE